MVTVRSVVPDHDGGAGEAVRLAPQQEPAAGHVAQFYPAKPSKHPTDQLGEPSSFQCDMTTREWARRRGEQ